MIEFSIVLFLVCLAAEGQTSSHVPTVPTSSGLLIGQRRDILQNSIVEFLGVPYAEPPIGHLRFKPPQEINFATEVRNATQYAPACYQPPHMKEVISPLLNTDQMSTVSEDCLTLNIFKCESTGQRLIPVMVWLPGEGFDYADAGQFDGGYLATIGEVIVVTVNYRVSVFGFLSTQTSDAPGNVGLLDQRMALKWIKKNIANFGGDPKKVTLFGRFTGSISSSIHLTSPLNQKEPLFQRVILQSGVATGEWVFDSNPLNSTLKLAELTDCLSSSLSSTISCLQKIPSHILLSKSFLVPQRWRPVFDNYLIKSEPLDAIKRGSYSPVDVMLGGNNDEGSLCLLSLYALKSPYYQKIIDNEMTEEDFLHLISTNILDFYKRQDNTISKLAAHEYNFLSGRTDLREKYIDFCSELYITSNMVKVADSLAMNKKGRVYMYNFAHRPTFSIQPTFIRAGLGDDVLFTLGLVHQLSSAPLDELLLSNRTVMAFSNFARNGVTTQGNVINSWPEYSVIKRHVMTLSTIDNPVSVKDSYDRSVSFWHEIVPELLVQHSLQGQFPGVTQNVTPHTKEQEDRVKLTDRKEDNVYFLGTFVSLATAEYVLLVLFCFCVLLFATSAASLLVFCRGKPETYFHRLR